MGALQVIHVAWIVSAGRLKNNRHVDVGWAWGYRYGEGNRGLSIIVNSNMPELPILASRPNDVPRRAAGGGLQGVLYRSRR